MRRRDIARKAVKTAIIVKAAQRLGQRAESTRGGTDHLARMLVVWPARLDVRSAQTTSVPR